jgi:hypothetical protein
VNDSRADKTRADSVTRVVAPPEIKRHEVELVESTKMDPNHASDRAYAGDAIVEGRFAGRDW